MSQRLLQPAQRVQHHGATLNSFATHAPCLLHQRLRKRLSCRWVARASTCRARGARPQPQQKQLPPLGGLTISTVEATAPTAMQASISLFTRSTERVRRSGSRQTASVREAPKHERDHSVPHSRYLAVNTICGSGRQHFKIEPAWPRLLANSTFCFLAAETPVTIKHRSREAALRALRAVPEVSAARRPPSLWEQTAPGPAANCPLPHIVR